MRLWLEKIWSVGSERLQHDYQMLSVSVKGGSKGKESLSSQRAGSCQVLGSSAGLAGTAPAGSPCPRTPSNQQGAAQGRENARLKLPQAPPVSPCACIPGCVGLCSPVKSHSDHSTPKSFLALSRALGNAAICTLQAPLSTCPEV